MSIIGESIAAGGKSIDTSKTALIRVTTNQSEIGNGIASRSSYIFIEYSKHLNINDGKCIYYFIISQNAFDNSSAFTITIDSENYYGSGTIVVPSAKEYSLSISMNTKNN